jgi:3-hydroxybutyryl-CoA dehydrogenase
MKINAIAVVGAGLMGHGIAQIFAQAGFRVRLTDSNPHVLGRALPRIQANLEIGIAHGFLDAEAAGEVPDRIIVSGDLAECVRDADFIVESVSEEMAVKHEVLAAIEAHCPGDAIIASNSSSFRVGEMGSVLANRSRFLGTHYWNPPHLIPVVEVICGAETSPEVVDLTSTLLRAVGKQPALVRKDVAGFVGNRLQHALRREALALVADGVASPEDIDLIARLSFGLRMPFVGPLETVDLAGLDLTLSIQRYLLSDLNRDTEPSPVVVDKVSQGQLGAKSGQGFFTWTEEEHQAAIQRRDAALIQLLLWIRGGGVMRNP